MICETQYGRQTIRFRLERRDVKSLAIHVQPAGLVEVIAPKDAEAQEICQRVSRRGRWVLRQQRTFKNLLSKVTSVTMRSGESVRYLGRQYRLRIRQGDAEGVELTRTVLEVSVAPHSRPDRAAMLVGMVRRTRPSKTLRTI